MQTFFFQVSSFLNWQNINMKNIKSNHAQIWTYSVKVCLLIYVNKISGKDVQSFFLWI